MWVLDRWRYFAHVMIMCISSRKAGKDAMGHDLAAAMVSLSLNKGYNFSRYIFKALNDQINTVERFRFLLYPRFVQLLIDDASACYWGEIASKTGGQEGVCTILKARQCRTYP
ncbi:hypothetical protein L1987_07195 [Smallanthus sonchifolius]|uniref:Uncharacterized protein n=1 Tax=Smallanthus sonchifolius TaxID=185202 RepID=A0ACB9K043_9ASTR|nr:hypothetical protein L1987_07195 [Smallanthus sonchifolius]